MLKALQDLERQYPEFFDPNSPTQRIEEVTKNFKTQAHRYPCTPFNTYSKEELLQWVGRVEKALGDENLNLPVS